MKMGDFGEAREDAMKAKELASRGIRPDSFRARKRTLVDSPGPHGMLPRSGLDMGAGFSLVSPPGSFLAVKQASEDDELAGLQSGGAGDGAGEAVVRVRLKLRCEVNHRETVWLTGNHPATGGWLLANGVKMLTSKQTYPVWSAVVALPQSALASLVYKYATRSAGGDQWRWEEAVGDRRIPKETVGRASGAGVDEIIIEDGAFNEPVAEAAGGAPPLTLRDASDPSTPRAGSIARSPSTSRDSSTAGSASGTTLVAREVAGGLTIQASVTLRVTVNTNYGEEVYICGSDASIGAWVPSRAVKMGTSAELYPDWTVTLPLPLSGSKVLYKYVIKAAADQFNWENRIPDRELVPDSRELFLNDGRFNQIQRQVTFQKLDAPVGAAPKPAGAKPRSSVLRSAEHPTAGSAQAAADYREALARKQLLETQIAELQRYRAVDLAELASLKARGGEGGGADRAMEDLRTAQEQMARLEEARGEVVRRARAHGLEVDKLREQNDLLDKAKVRLTVGLRTEEVRKAGLEERLRAVRGELREAQEVSNNARAELTARSQAGSGLVAQLHGQLGQLRARQAELQAAVERQVAQCAPLETTERDLQAVLLEIHQEGIRSEKDMERQLLAINDEQVAARAAQEGEMAALAGRYAAAHARVAAAAASVEAHGRQNAAWDGQLGEMDVAMKGLEKTIARMEDEMTGVTKRCSDFSGEKAQLLRQQVSDFRESVRTADSRRDAVARAVARQAAEQLAAEAEAHALAARGMLLTASLQTRKSSIVAGRERIDAISLQTNTTLRLLKNTTLQIQEEIAEHFAALEKEREALEDALSFIEQQNRMRAASVEKLRGILTTIRAQVEELQGEQEDWKASNGKMAEELEEVTKNNADLQAQLRTASKTSSDLRRDMETLNGTVTTMEVDLNNTEFRRDALEDLMSRGRAPTKAEIADFEDTVERMEETRRVLEREKMDTEEVLQYLQGSASAQGETSRRIIDGLRPKVAAVEKELRQAFVDDVEAQEHNVKLGAALCVERDRWRAEGAKLQAVRRERFLISNDREAATARERRTGEVYVQHNNVLQHVRKELVELQELVRGVRAQIAEQKALHEQAEINRQLVDNQVHERQAMIRKLEADRQNCFQNIESLLISDLEEEKASVTETLIEEKRGVGMIQSDLASREKEYTASWEACQEAKRELAVLERQQEALEMRQSHTAVAVEALRRENWLLDAASANAEAELREVHAEAAAQEAEHTGKTTATRQAQEMVSLMRKEHTKLEAEVLELTKQLEEQRALASVSRTLEHGARENVDGVVLAGNEETVLQPESSAHVDATHPPNWSKSETGQKSKWSNDVGEDAAAEEITEECYI